MIHSKKLIAADLTDFIEVRRKAPRWVTQYVTATPYGHSIDKYTLVSGLTYRDKGKTYQFTTPATPNAKPPYIVVFQSKTPLLWPLKQTIQIQVNSSGKIATASPPLLTRQGQFAQLRPDGIKIECSKPGPTHKSKLTDSVLIPIDHFKLRFVNGEGKEIAKPYSKKSLPEKGIRTRVYDFDIATKTLTLSIGKSDRLANMPPR